MRQGWKTLRLMTPMEILAIVLLVGAAALTTALAPVALKAGIDRVGKSASGYLSSGGLFICLYIAGLALARALNEAQQAYYSKAEQSAVNRQRLALVSLFLRLPLQQQTERSSTEFQQHLNNAARSTSIFLQTMLLSLAPTAIQMVTIAVVIWGLYDYLLLLVFLAGTSAYVWVFGRGMQIANLKQRDAILSTNKITITASDSFTHPEANKLFGLEAFHYNRINAASASSLQLWKSYYKFRLVNGLLIACIFSLTFGGAILIAYSRLVSGHMSIGDFMLVSAYALLIIHPMEQLGAAYRNMRQAQILMEPIHVLQAVPGSSAMRGALASRKVRSAREIALVNVTFRYGPADEVLRGVSLRASVGRRMAFVGKTGSGKTTALRILLGLYPASTGQVLVDQTNIADVPPEDLVRNVFAVPQEPALFNCTLRENILFGAESRCLEQALDKACLSELLASGAHTLDEPVGERGVKLSGGQRQKVGFARLFALRESPNFIVLDEATSSMDYSTERTILGTLYLRYPKSGLIVIAHRLDSIKDFDDIVVFDGGTIVSCGIHANLLASCPVYRNLWGSQSGPTVEECVA